LENRREFLYMLSAAGVASTVGAALPGEGLAADAPSSDSLQLALRSSAAPVRTIDFAGDDFTDLELLGKAIASARVVQLGEPSHGSGSAFAAKARMVKFLHQRHGFDVLIWESGLYDVALAQAEMRSTSSDAVTAARKGIFTLWSEAAEIKPLFEYIKASQATLRPLDIAGFDIQVTADGTTERFAQDLHVFVGTLDDPPIRKQAVSLADDITAARNRLYASKFSDPRDLAALTDAVRALQALLSTKRTAFEAIRGELDISFMDHALENMRADAALRVETAKSRETTPARESGRDALNAANLRWLLEEKYTGRKALVWAHNVHVMNAYYAPAFRDLHLEQHPGDMKTTGVYMKKWLGDEVYTIGITAFEGQEGFAMGGPKSPVAPAPDGSLEANLHSLGYAFAFVDFRSIRNKAANPLRDRLAVRTPKFDINVVSDVGRIYDGMFFIDQMAAASRV
jgi:erythromycin esterase